MVNVSLGEIVDRFGGALSGPRRLTISGIASLAGAESGDITFLSDLRYKHLLSKTRASAVILPEGADISCCIPAILSADPYLYFAEVANLLNPQPRAIPGRHESASIDAGAHVSGKAQIGSQVSIGAGARIAADSIIGAGCHIGAGVEIGRGTVLYPNVAIYAGCKLGRRVIVHAGAVIGADGFGMARKRGRWLKIPQIGRVIIGDDVEIGANTTVDRGALDDTVIEKGVKLDNQIQVGHNVRIGAHTAIAGCVGIAGSATIGKNCTIGGGAVILGHLRLADGVHVSAGTLITKSILSPGTYTGAYPFSDHLSWGRSAAALRSLGELVQRVRMLERGGTFPPEISAPDPGAKSGRGNRKRT
jgi:UDP-3-O-[3-hydroxymyristoyl] glucosamine N-acyltransferase